MCSGISLRVPGGDFLIEAIEDATIRLSGEKYSRQRIRFDLVTHTGVPRRIRMWARDLR